MFLKLRGQYCALTDRHTGKHRGEEPGKIHTLFILTRLHLCVNITLIYLRSVVTVSGCWYNLGFNSDDCDIGSWAFSSASAKGVVEKLCVGVSADKEIG